MALKIVTADSSQPNLTPLQLWYRDERVEAVEALAAPTADAEVLLSLMFEQQPDLLARAGALLADWSDEIEAYRVLKRASEHLLDQMAGATQAEWLERGWQLVDLLRPWLDRRPAEVVLLNYLAVAAYGGGDAARALQIFKAVRKLDPEVENIDGSIASATGHKSRKAAKSPITLRHLPRHRKFLDALPKRALRERRPVSISLCMIVKDEEEMLPDCLRSVAGVVDEMVIVDTGSTDLTREIAESFGATVLDFPWVGDFAAARNYGIDRARGTHVLWLDADERIEDDDRSLLVEYAKQEWRDGWWFSETNYTGGDDNGTSSTHMALRLFRLRSDYRFTGIIHEQLRSQMPLDLPERFGVTPMRIRHYGYLKSRVAAKDKHTRNLELLMRELQAKPDNAFTLFNIGTEYLASSDIASARDYLERAYATLLAEENWEVFGFAPLLVNRLISARRALGDYPAAIELARSAQAVMPDFTDLEFELGLNEQARGEPAAAERHFETCLELGESRGFYAGVTGRGSYLAKCALAELAERRGDHARSEELLREVLESHPEYLNAGFALSSFLLSRPDAQPAAVLAEVRGAVPPSPTWTLLLATALYERNWVVEAEELFREALSVRSTAAVARVGLVEALVSQQRYTDAALLADAPGAAGTDADTALRRLGVLAASLSGDREMARRIATQAKGEQETLCLIIEALVGQPIESPPAPEAIDLDVLLLILEGLATLGEVDAFGRVEQLLALTDLDPQERMITVAETLARRNYWRAAAEQAMRYMDAAGPTARGLAVVGKAAVAEEFYEDAIPVLEACLELDPSQLAIARLLTLVRDKTGVAV